MKTLDERLVFTDRWAARRRAAWDFIYRFWWIPAALILIGLWHTYGGPN